MAPVLYSYKGEGTRGLLIKEHTVKKKGKERYHLYPLLSQQILRINQNSLAQSNYSRESEQLPVDSECT
jgi:hypothetical protein